MGLGEVAVGMGSAGAGVPDSVGEDACVPPHAAAVAARHTRTSAPVTRGSLAVFVDKREYRMRQFMRCVTVTSRRVIKSA
ncbi:hypothetical protein Ssi02_60160 [Sinosporangium siamense]|uniref:Uncharacterized protein n=1 Tax=Sinosporangium siamense TaxID=1367973 RepID=A0A919RL17_9ACTN|nr:hypothetical protein Ssi02_60160 [Sinosporangium siamense]